MAEPPADTARLGFRDWRESDRVDFYERMNRPEVMRWLGGPQTPAQWDVPFDRLLAMAPTHGHAFWVIEHKASGEILGFCGIKRVNSPGTEMTGRHEIGWRFHPDAWGRGIAKEAAIASLDHAFGALGAPHVIAMTVIENEPSWGLMERLGMTRRPDLDFRDTRFGDELNPQIIWSIDAADWPAARARALAPR
ncbi:GNAT family N-acetyltransferase [Sphingomonas sp. ASV193]|uniref:GNAT family N-acetyltransferase n=1 Tax=Sphingomonas sp. ASV193 TaxID=3144405 RepID=UPI0032E8CE72